MEVVGPSPTKAQIFKIMKHESKNSVLAISQCYDALHIRSICCQGACLVVHNLYLYRHIVCITDIRNKSEVLGRSKTERIICETVFVSAQ